MYQGDIWLESSEEIMPPTELFQPIGIPTQR
jgi:hypothetical protein